MMGTTLDWLGLARRLSAALALGTPPLAITFRAAAPPFDGPMPEPGADGRTGRVPAGCVFWVHGTERTFSTVAADHANCSVGSVTHGFATLEDVAARSDVATLLETGWVRAEDVAGIPAVAPGTEAVTYGPLAETPVDPDVVLLRLNPKQVMVLHDALGELRIEGKPQCHIVAVAKEEGVPAASVGCALSRVRTGMPATEMTCALPAGRLAEVVEAVEATAATDAAVARYAAQDARRFA
jgi:uncharacterized protein (DUF169 family)